MERETKEVTTPIGQQKVVLKEWLTGRERRDIRSVLLEEVNFEQNTDSSEAKPAYKIHGSVLNKAQDKAFESVVVSVDGNAENIVNIILDMRDEDFDFIQKEIDKITGGIDEEDKKK